MKKYYIIIIAFLGCLGLQAKDMTGLKIYINPGHGGYDSDDRNVAVYPYAQGDTLGFWESSSNLHKGLMLRELLQEQGAGGKPANGRPTCFSPYTAMRPARAAGIISR